MTLPDAFTAKTITMPTPCICKEADRIYRREYYARRKAS